MDDQACFFTNDGIERGGAEISKVGGLSEEKGAQAKAHQGRLLRWRCVSVVKSGTLSPCAAPGVDTRNYLQKCDRTVRELV